jgi:DNA replication licensing factor MCM2
MQETIYQNYQKITLQESPANVPAGRVPRQKDVILLHDLINSCSPGEEIDVTGIYKHTYDQNLNKTNGFPVFSTVLMANYVEKKDEKPNSSKMTEEDVREIIKLSKKPNIGKILINSLAPSIYGMEHCKTAVALSLFGGVAKEFENKHRIRGDINVLMLGKKGETNRQRENVRFLMCFFLRLAVAIKYVRDIYETVLGF